jgi:hypothetical protein
MSSVNQFLELTIQNLRAENQELKKRVEGLTDWGKGILSEYNKVCAENDDLNAFIAKVMERVQGGTSDAEEEKTDQQQDTSTPDNID